MQVGMRLLVLANTGTDSDCDIFLQPGLSELYECGLDRVLDVMSGNYAQKLRLNRYRDKVAHSRSLSQVKPRMVDLLPVEERNWLSFTMDALSQKQSVDILDISPFRTSPKCLKCQRQINNGCSYPEFQ